MSLPSDEIREKAILALTSTTRKQCTHGMVRGDSRCALGVIAEGLGLQWVGTWRRYLRVVEGGTDAFPVLESFEAHELELAPGEFHKLTDMLTTYLSTYIMFWNDSEKLTFDQIAAKIKEWPECPLNPGL